MPALSPWTTRRVRFACMRALYGGAIALVLTVAASLVNGQERLAFPGMLDQHPAIDYRNGPLTDAGTQLPGVPKSGAASLQFEGREGYLRAVLAKLQVP